MTIQVSKGGEKVVMPQEGNSNWEGKLSLDEGEADE